MIHRDAPSRLKGQVLIITLLAMTMLVGLVFYVYNLGDRVNSRLSLQHTADSAAISGATWMARSMNVVAMNNISESRLIAMAAILDAVPMASEMAADEILTEVNGDSLYKGLQGILQSSGFPDSRLEKRGMPPTNFGKTSADAVLFLTADQAKEMPSPPVYYQDLANNSSGQRRVDAKIALRKSLEAKGTVVEATLGGNGWSESNANNEHGGSSLETLTPGATYEFSTKLAPGTYWIFAWWSCDKDGSHRDAAAKYTVGNRTVTVNQSQNTGWWHKIGELQDPINPIEAIVSLKASGGGQDQQFKNFLREGLERLSQELSQNIQVRKTQLEQLLEIDNSLDSADEKKPEGGYAVQKTTWWDNDGSRGRIWEAATALNDLTRATVKSAGALAQADATRQVHAGEAQKAFIAPVIPKIPAKSGTFNDYLPVLAGREIVKSDKATVDMTIYGLIKSINDRAARLRSLDRSMTSLAEELRDLYEQYDKLPPGSEKNEIQKQIEQKEKQIRAQESQYRSTDDARLQSLLTLHRMVRGGAIPDMEFHQRLGPFARLFKWRHPTGYWESHGDNWSPGHAGNPAWGGGGGGGRRWNSWRRFIQSGYQTYGPYFWCMMQFTNDMGNPGWHNGALDATNFSKYTRLLSNIKFGYLFGLEPQKVRYNYRWITDYQKAKEFLVEEEARRKEAHRTGTYYVSKIHRTRYYRINLGSSIDWTDPRWLCDTRTFHAAQGIDANSSSRWIQEHIGWYDIVAPNKNKPGNRPDIVEWELTELGTSSHPAWRLKVHQYLPYNKQMNRFCIIQDQRINLFPCFDASDGDPISWHIYAVAWYFFGGIEVFEETADITNPYNWSAESEIPYPTLLDTSIGEYNADHDAGDRRKNFTLLGLATSSNNSLMWNRQFGNASPGGRMLAMAQAEIFNNSSWDLWTQDWRAQLVPITDMPNWIDRINSGVPDAASTFGQVQSTDIDSVLDYLRRMDERMLEMYLNH